MSASSVGRLGNALVPHVAASAGFDRDEHADFVRLRLVISFAALAAAPVFLVVHGVPTLAQTMVFACSFAPLAAAITAARTGRSVLAHGVAALGAAALGLVLWLGLGCGAPCAVAWLFAAVVETKLAHDSRVSRFADPAMAAALLAIVVGGLACDLPPAPNGAVSTIWTGLALVYGWIVGAGASFPRRTQQADEEAATWHAVAEAIDNTVLGLDGKGAVHHVRSTSTAEIGIAADTLMGSGLLETVHPDDRRAFHALLEAAALGQETATAKLRLRAGSVGADELAPHRGGFSLIEVRARRVAVSVQGNSSTRLVAVLRNVETIEHETDDAIAATRAFVVQSEARSLATMRHELRTPLNAIIGFSEILASRTLAPVDRDKQRAYAQIINQSGQQLLSLVNSVFQAPDYQTDSSSNAIESFGILHSDAQNSLDQRMKEVA